MKRRFRDRAHAGVELSAMLEAYRDVDAVVLGLPRGGVAVAAPVADALDLPLDAYVVRKLGVPGHEELAMGAIASGGVVVWNDDVLSSLRIADDRREAVVAHERAEPRASASAHRGDRPPVTVSGSTMIVVDDGLATGATMHAAVGVAGRGARGDRGRSPSHPIGDRGDASARRRGGGAGRPGPFRCGRRVVRRLPADD